MKRLITAALPYVNNLPHLGNIIGCVLSADVYARFCRLKKYQSLYICGTDEYGTATEIKAIEEGKSPKEICDKYHQLHKKIYEWFGISFDSFGRTSTQKHTEITQEIFLSLKNNGHIIEEESMQFYDQTADIFLADRYIEGKCPNCQSEGARADQCDKCGKLMQPGDLINPISKVSKTTPIMKKTTHLFLNLPDMEKPLSVWIKSHEGNWSTNTSKIAESWLNEGLKKRSITRDLKWGVPVPLKGYEKKVFYVWFDAPIGYISITANHTENWKEWWMNPKEVKLYQFMGKDNVPFHSVIFPSTLLGTKQNWTLVHHINTTEFLNYEGGKFSKSRGIGVFGDDAMNSGIPADVWRYYLLSNRPEQADTNFSWDDFADKNNNELLANFGNLINRTLVFIMNNFEGTIPEAKIDDEIIVNQKELEKEIDQLLDSVKLKDALHKIMAYSKNANKYFQDNKPWELVKTDKVAASIVLGNLAYMIKNLSILIEPFLPNSSSVIRKQMKLNQLNWADLDKPIAVGQRISIPNPLFRKIELKEIAELRDKFAEKKKTEIKTSFSDLELEVGIIESIEKHPNAEKLYVEKIRLHDGIRQIVSGLVQFYSADELLGKKVVVLRNLKSATIRGSESQGMVLAADNLEKQSTTDNNYRKVEVLSPEKSEVGQKIIQKGIKSNPKKELTFDEFKSVKIEVIDGKIYSEGSELHSESETLSTKWVKKGIVG